MADGERRVIRHECGDGTAHIDAGCLAAQQRIGDQLCVTPCCIRAPSRAHRCAALHQIRNLQFTASFKERGALNRLLQLTPAERCAASARCRRAIMDRQWPITHTA